MMLRVGFWTIVLLPLLLWSGLPLDAQTGSSGAGKDKDDSAKSSSESKAASPAPPYASILKDAKPAMSGMWTVFEKGNNLYWEITSSDYSSEYIVMIAISRGIAQGDL